MGDIISLKFYEKCLEVRWLHIVVGIIILLVVLLMFFEYLFYIIGGIFALLGLFFLYLAKNANDNKKLSDEQLKEKYHYTDKKTLGFLSVGFLVIGIVSVCICGLSLKYQTGGWHNSVAEEKIERKENLPEKKQAEIDTEPKKEQKQSFCIVEGVGKVKAYERDGLRMAVYGISEQKTIEVNPIGNLVETLKANGKYVLIDVISQNYATNKKVGVTLSDFYLIDENGRIYPAYDKAENGGEQFIGYFEDLRPGQVYGGAVVFEVPRDFDASKSKLKYKIYSFSDDKNLIIPVRVEIVQ